MRPELSAASPVGIPEPRSLRVLVVDDSEAVVKSLGWAIELMGHQVMMANSGTEAVAVAKDFKPEVVVLDLGLPGMDGYEVCHELRHGQGLTDAVFIAQTGWGEQHRARIKEAGFRYHLVKPVSIDSLETLLNSLNIPA